jgi:predicted nucleic acid-binding protein
MIVVADTSPPLHLGRIGRLDLLPAVVGRVIIPRTVWGELVQPGTRPDVVAAIQATDWIEIVEDPGDVDLGLDPGETAAILLAERLRADALLIDERRGRAVAATRGISLIGTLGMLEEEPVEVAHAREHERVSDEPPSPRGTGASPASARPFPSDIDVPGRG